MGTRIDHDRLALLFSRSTENDAAIAKAIGVNQSTVWRLRKGKIEKVGKYLPMLEAHLGVAVTGNASDEIQLLTELAHRSPALAEMLTALSRFMQERA